MGENEETAVEAEESAEEAAMKGKGSEVLQKTKDREDDLLEQRSIWTYVTSKHHQQRRGIFVIVEFWGFRTDIPFFSLSAFSYATLGGAGRDVAGRLRRLWRWRRDARCTTYS